MSWTSPRTWSVGEIVTKVLMDLHLRDNLRYLKGLDGVPTIESGLIVDNTDGDEYVKLPLLSTAEASTVLAAEGKIAHDEQTHRIKVHDGTAVRSVVSTADVDDTPVNGATTDPISSNWAYDFINTLTTAGDLAYATAAGVWARLDLGTVGQVLRVNAGETAPEWAASVATKEFFVAPNAGTGAWGAFGGFAVFALTPAGEYANFNFRVPNDFASLTSLNMLVIPYSTTGTFDWTVDTTWGTSGEAYNANTDSVTADAQAATGSQLLAFDISGAFTGLAANDIVGVKFTLDVLTTTENLYVLGLNFKYT